MKEYLTMRLPLRREMMTTVRLAAGGVCSAAGMSYDGGEDCKLCVTESLLLMMRRGFTAAEVRFFPAPQGGIAVRAEGTEGEAAMPATDEDEIALALLSALAENVDIDREKGVIAFLFGQQA